MKNEAATFMLGLFVVFTNERTFATPVNGQRFLPPQAQVIHRAQRVRPARRPANGGKAKAATVRGYVIDRRDHASSNICHFGGYCEPLSNHYFP